VSLNDSPLIYYVAYFVFFSAVGGDRSAKTLFIIYRQKYVSEPNSHSNIPTSVLRLSSQKCCSRKSCQREARKERGRAPLARLHRLRLLNRPAKRRTSRNSGPLLHNICHHQRPSFVYYLPPRKPISICPNIYTTPASP
jgi:hypothetical protein